MSLIVKLCWRSLSALFVGGLLLVSACKDDEKPSAGIAFAETESEVFETGENLQVKIAIDKPVSETVLLSYTLSGTATEATVSVEGDYTTSPVGGYITIAPGSTEATIEIDPIEDSDFEVELVDNTLYPYDSIIITLTAVTSGPGKLLQQTVHTVRILEDDLLIVLDWNPGTGQTADLDLMLWIENPAGSGKNQLVGLSNDTESAANNSGEGVYLIGGYPDRKFGVSYTYYAGTSNSVALDAQFLNFGGVLNGGPDALSFSATYTLNNIKNYGSKSDALNGLYVPAVAITQTFMKNKLNYTNITNINVPTSGSRKATSKKVLSPELFNKLKKNIHNYKGIKISN